MTQPVRHSEFEEAFAQHYRSLLDLAVEIKALKFYLALRRAAGEAKANFNPNQPRVPRGSADGGQWTRTGCGASPAPQVRLVQVRLPSSVAAPVWQGLYATAQGLRAAQSRVEALAEEHFPGGLQALALLPDATTEFVFSLGGEPGRRAYADWIYQSGKVSALGAQILRENLDREIARGTITRQQAEDVTVVAMAAAAGAGGKRRSALKPGKRPTWQESETNHATKKVATRKQVSFKEGQEVRFGTKGSVRPDACDDVSCTFEIKNYNLANNSRGLVSNAARQAIQRSEHIPKHLEQRIVIDVTGQKVTRKELNLIADKIVNRSNGVLKRRQVSFEGFGGSR